MIEACLCSCHDKQLSNFDDVVAFHEKFGLKYNGPSRILPPALQQFRLNFLVEELEEYSTAVRDNDLCGAADALADLVYVALGTAYMHGFPWQQIWNEVQRANMGKVRAERAEQSTRGTTFDVIKPSGWTPPDHTAALKVEKEP